MWCLRRRHKNNSKSTRKKTEELDMEDSTVLRQEIWWKSKLGIFLQVKRSKSKYLMCTLWLYLLILFMSSDCQLLLLPDTSVNLNKIRLSLRKKKVKEWKGLATGQWSWRSSQVRLWNMFFQKLIKSIHTLSLLEMVFGKLRWLRKKWSQIKTFLLAILLNNLNNRLCWSVNLTTTLKRLYPLCLNFVRWVLMMPRSMLKKTKNRISTFLKSKESIFSWLIEVCLWKEVELKKLNKHSLSSSEVCLSRVSLTLFPLEVDMNFYFQKVNNMDKKS